MSAVLSEIISLLTDGIVEYAGAFGTGLGSAAESIFLTTGEGGAVGLSTFGGLIVVFAALSLAIGVTKLIFNWVTSLGASN